MRLTNLEKLPQLGAISSRTIRYGALAPERIPLLAKQQGHGFACLADPNFTAALPTFLNACREHQIPPVIGAWFLLEEKSGDILRKRARSRDPTNVPYEGPGDLLILARSPRGLRTLTEISTQVLTQANRQNIPVLKTKDLQALQETQNQEDLAFLAAGKHTLEGLVQDQKTPHNPHDPRKNINIFGICLRGQSQPPGVPEPGESQLRDLAHQQGIPCVGAVPWRAEPDTPRSTLAMLDALRKNITHERAFQDTPKVFTPLDEASLQKCFQDSPQLLTNARSLALTCQAHAILPPESDPDRHLYYQDHQDQDNQILRQQAEQKLNQKIHGFPLEKQRTYRKRLEHELQAIQTTGYAGIYLVASDLMAWLKQQNTLTGPGRGSAAGSLVSWVLGITTPDPIKHGLWFERFINVDRISPPDFDLDVEPHWQSRMQDKLRELWDQKANPNQTRSSGIASWNTIKAAAGFRASAQTRGIPRPAQDKAIRKLRDSDHPSAALWTRGAVLTTPEPAQPAQAAQAAQAQEQEDTPLIDIPSRSSSQELDPTRIFQNLLIKNSKAPTREERELGACVEDALNLSMGKNRATNALSRHPAAIALLRSPAHKQGLPHVLPTGTKSNQEESPILQIDHDEAEQAGAVKVDCLGIAALSLVKLVQENQKTQQNQDPWNLPHDDHVFEMLAQGNTLGVFQFEGTGITRIVRNIRPRNLQELTIIAAMYRPGPMSQLEAYAARKRGEARPAPPHAKLEEILAPTQGIVVYQEQAMATAVALAGFNPSEADMLRRAIGKKKPKEMIALKERFIEGCQTATPDLSPDQIQYIWTLLEGQAGYAFNLAHATCYTILGYATAYYKYHHPGAFLAALATTALVRAESNERLKAIQLEAARLGIQILPPDLTRSRETFLWQPETQSILAPPQAIHGLGKNAVQLAKIPLDERPTTVRGWNRILAQHHIDSKQATSLAYVGALRSLKGGNDPKYRQPQNWNLDIHGIQDQDQDQPETISQETQEMSNTEEDETQIQKLWPYGKTWVLPPRRAQFGLSLAGGFQDIIPTEFERKQRLHQGKRQQDPQADPKSEHIALIMDVQRYYFSGGDRDSLPRIRVTLGDAHSLGEFSLSKDLTKILVTDHNKRTQNAQKQAILEEMLQVGKPVIATTNEHRNPEIINLREIPSQLAGVRPPFGSPSSLKAPRGHKVSEEPSMPPWPPVLFLVFPPETLPEELWEKDPDPWRIIHKDIKAMIQNYRPGSTKLVITLETRVCDLTLHWKDRIIPDPNLARAFQSRFPGIEIYHIDPRTGDPQKI